MTRPTTLHRDKEIFKLYIGSERPPMAPKDIKDIFCMDISAVYKAIARGRLMFRERRKTHRNPNVRATA